MNKPLPNIIFLDIDGVLCNPRSSLAVRNNGMYSYLDPIACLLVKRLCEDCNAKIVISSSWRIGHDLDYMQSVLNAACPSLGSYIWNSQTNWRTPTHVFVDDRRSCRGDEIADWIARHSSEFNNFCILDDDADMGHLMESLVLCNPYDGIGFMEYHKAEKMLMKNFSNVLEE